jgi:cation:H+ antiporter
LWLISYQPARHAWQPTPKPEIGETENARNRPKDLGIAVKLCMATGLIIVVAGFVLARSGEAVAEQTGLGSSFVGALFVGLSTSLPEISTVVSAVRLGRYLLAFSDIFGTNIIDIALIGLVDAVFLGGPVLNEVGTFSIFTAILGIAVTLLYLAGLVERRDLTFGRLGMDSWAVVVTWLGGVAILFVLR